MRVFYQKLLPVLVVVFMLGAWFVVKNDSPTKEIKEFNSTSAYWFELHRKSDVEYFFFGKPGDKNNSFLLKEFKVKSGVPNSRPTPLPKLLGRDYWLIVDKVESGNNLETAPYFITLDIPVTENEPYGPEPYLECNGQCNWILPGYFGLHGVNGDETKLSQTNEGSSGCVRHRDLDITFLYNTLEIGKGEIRYYVEDI